MTDIKRTVTVIQIYNPDWHPEHVAGRDGSLSTSMKSEM